MALDTIPSSTLDYLSAQERQVIVRQEIARTIQGQNDLSLLAMQNALRENEFARSIDEQALNDAVRNLESATGAHGYSKVQNLPDGVLGTNRVGTKDTRINTALVQQAAEGNTKDLALTLKHENDGHGTQVTSTEDIVGADGEVISVWEQLEGHAEHVSNPHGRRAGQPADYKAAQDKFEANNTAALSAYVTGASSKVATQKRIFAQSSLNLTEKRSALETVGYSDPEITQIIGQTRYQFENGPDAAVHMQLAA